MEVAPKIDQTRRAFRPLDDRFDLRLDPQFRKLARRALGVIAGRRTVAELSRVAELELAEG